MRTARLPTILLAALALAAGCQSDTPPPTVAAAPTTTKPVALATLTRAESRLPVVHLDVYQMAVPRGAVSRSEEFWKRVDELQIDPATYDVLRKNGVRAGVAPDRDWDYFRDILERNNAKATWGSVMAGASGSLELSMRKNIAAQDIFYLSDQNDLYGRTYERCEDLLGLSFWPDPRHAGALHLAVAPIVRATRSRLEYRRNGEEQEIVEVRPEFLYDLNLRVMIPRGSFLVIGPSPEGTWPTSLGNAFLTLNGEAEQKEQVLVLVPRTVRFGDPATAMPAPAGAGRK